MKRNPAARTVVRVQDVCAAIEYMAPAAWAYDWDNVGLQVGDPEAPVSRILVALTVTRDVIAAAQRAKASMIVAHHPLIWRPLKTLREDTPTAALCVELVRANIACFVAHTNLDVAPEGVNAALAEQLGLKEVKPLLPAPQARQVKLVTFVPESHLAAVQDAVFKSGAGHIGDYACCSFSALGTGTFTPSANARPFLGETERLNEEPERRFEVLVAKERLPKVLEALLAAHPYEEPAYDIIALENPNPRAGLGVRGVLGKPMPLDRFAKYVRDKLDATATRFVGDAECQIQNVAVIGGSGGGEASQMPPGIDVLVTGDLKYHDALAALDAGVAVVDAGHAAMEKWALPRLANYVRNTLPIETAVCLESEVFTNL